MATVRAMISPVAFLVAVRTCHAKEVAFTVASRFMTSQTTTMSTNVATTSMWNTSTSTATATGPDDTHLVHVGHQFMIWAVAAIAIPCLFYLLLYQRGREHVPSCLITLHQFVATCCFIVLLSMPAVFYVIFALDVRTNAVHKDVLTWSLSLVPIAFLTMFIVFVLGTCVDQRTRVNRSSRTKFFLDFLAILVCFCFLVMLMALVIAYFAVGWEGVLSQHSWGAGALAWGIILILGMFNTFIFKQMGQHQTEINDRAFGYVDIPRESLEKCLKDVNLKRCALPCAKIFLNLYNLTILWIRIPAFDTNIPSRTALHMIAWVEVPVVYLCLIGFLLMCLNICYKIRKETHGQDQTAEERERKETPKIIRQAAHFFILLQDLSSLNLLRTCSPTDLKSRWRRMSYLDPINQKHRKEKRMFLLQQVINLPFCLLIGIMALRIKMIQVSFFMEEHVWNLSLHQWVTLLAFFNNVMGIIDTDVLRMRAMLCVYGFDETWLDHLADQIIKTEFRSIPGTFALMTSLGSMPEVCALLNLSQAPRTSGEFPTMLTKLVYAPGNTSIMDDIAISLASQDTRLFNDIFRNFFHWSS